MIKMIKTKGAPEAVGPYAQAVKHGNLIFCSGQVSINPDTGEIVRGTVAEQTKWVMENIKAVLQEAGSDMDHVMKMSIYLTDMKTFGEMNEVYASYFLDYYPARITVEVGELYGGLGVEIDCIAVEKA